MHQCNRLLSIPAAGFEPQRADAPYCKSASCRPTESRT